MARSVRARPPRVPAQVEKVELSDKHIVLRLIAAAVFLIAGASALAYSISGFFTGVKGWREIGTDGSDGISAAQDFVFMYNIGAEGSVSRENREITSLYSETARKAYELFNVSLEFEGVNNLNKINKNPNAEITVDPALYEALSQISESGTRDFYLGPVLEIYNGVFSAETEENTFDYDPRQNVEIGKLFSEICKFATDPESINIEILGENRVKLFVSNEYLDFCSREELYNFTDFGWMKNAFIADFIANTLISAGYTRGELTSSDGFSVNLGGEECSLTVFHLDGGMGGTVYPLGTMSFAANRSAVYLKNYRLGAADSENIRLIGGVPRTKYLSASDGLNREALDDLTAYSDSLGCAEIALKLAPIYIAEALDQTALASLHDEGIDAVYAEAGSIYYTADQAPFEPEGYETVSLRG